LKTESFNPLIKRYYNKRLDGDQINAEFSVSLEMDPINSKDIRSEAKVNLDVLGYTLPSIFDANFDMNIQQSSFNLKIFGQSLYQKSIPTTCKLEDLYSKSFTLFHHDFIVWVIIAPVDFSVGVSLDTKIQSKLCLEMNNYNGILAEITPEVGLTITGGVDINIGIAKVGIDLDVTLETGFPVQAVIGANPDHTPGVNFDIKQVIQPLSAQFNGHVQDGCCA
jgi:hypothetical protein